MASLCQTWLWICRGESSLVYRRGRAITLIPRPGRRAFTKARAVVDRLKRSLEQIEAPICPSCQTEMKWFQSSLLSVEPVTIKHQFSCPKCGSLLATQSDVSGSRERRWAFVPRRLRRVWHLWWRESFSLQRSMALPWQHVLQRKGLAVFKRRTAQAQLLGGTRAAD
jgi:hypothetical protein